MNGKDSHLKANAFSLIELLVVVTLIGILGILSTQIVILNVRSQAKSEIIKEVKQNGDYVLNVMERMLRNASDIELTSCNTNTQALGLVSPDGLKTTFDCSDGVSIASVSGELPIVRLPLTSSSLIVPFCSFRIVCPTPPVSPKYIFILFTLSQAGSGLPQEQRASSDFQSTVSLRSYE